MVSFRSYLAALVGLLLVASAVAAPSVGGTTNIAQWLAAQTNIQTWSADFVQTRTLKALVQPLKSEGHLWFAAPNRFRWELGQPPQTIAIRNTNEMVIVYPKLKRAERYPLTGNETGQWRDMLALLDAGFPRNQAEMESRFRVVSVTETNSKSHLTLEPKSAQARRLMREIELVLDAKSFLLSATELRFADGSTLRNDFTNAVVNVPFDDKSFVPVIPPEYAVVEPLKSPKRR